MSETAKRLERAEKHLQKGKLSSALEEFRAVVADDPTNDFVRQRAADLCVSLDLSSEAAGYLTELYDRFAAQARTAEAVGTYKKLVRLGPVSSARTFKYAQLILKTSPREALTALNTVFEDFKTSEKQRAVSCIQLILELEPSAENYHRAAELAEANGDNATAALHYLHIGSMEENRGRDGASHFEKAYSLDPHNTTAALAHSRCLLRESRPDRAVEILQVLTLNTPEYLDTYGNALLMSHRIDAAESVVLKYFALTPNALPMIGEVLSAYLGSGQAPHAIEFARSLEPKMRARGTTREYVALLRELVDRHSSSTELLEYLAQVYNATNREGDYCSTLLRLFELYFAKRNFMKAADCLERATDVDAYEPGHAERLELLRGKIDANKFNTIAGRLTSVDTALKTNPALSHDEEEVEPEPEKTQEPTVLEDLMLQAEIFLQYSMRSKAVERLERINKLFPHEEQKREKLAQIFAAAGFVPKYDDVQEPKSASSAAVADENAVDNFAKVTEITRNISRQSSVKSVLFATVNDVGRHWNVSRCVAGLSAPGKPPSAAMEYCAPGVAKSDVMGLARLISTLQVLAVKSGPVAFEKAQQAPDLQNIKQVLTSQKIDSLMAVPLLDGEEHLGLIMLEQCTGSRIFGKVDQVVLSTIAEQVVLAVNNARLRSLVKTLAPTDEKSGLLRRSSYLDVLLSEVQRSLPQKTPVTIALMNFGPASALVKEVGEVNVESAMQEIGHAVAAGIRQNDIAVRYSMTTIALILADTTDKNAFFVLDKLRKSTSTLHIPGRSEPVMLTAGIAELVMQPKYEPVDIVTEAINRVELALEIARHEGGNKAHSLAPMYETQAVSA